jgi:integrase
MALTNTAVRNAKAKDRAYKLTDERGLYLLVKPTAKYFRFGYRFEGKRKTLALGVYPDIGLADARAKRDEARKLLADGIDPSIRRRAVKTARIEETTNSFEAVAREWYLKFSPSWAASHGDKIKRRLERDVFPWIGERPIAKIAAPDLLTVLRRIESRGAIETAHRALQNCGRVFRFAVATGRADRDPCGDLRGALAPVKSKNFAAITDPKVIGELLRALDGYQGSPVTKAALRLAPLVFVRPGELRKAEWTEFDLDRAEWNIPKSRMKMREPHLVPLSKQAVGTLRELEPITCSNRYVFPGAHTNGRPMSDNAILAALRRMGFGKEEMSGHGFRAMARTVLDEVLHCVQITSNINWGTR